VSLGRSLVRRTSFVVVGEVLNSDEDLHGQPALVASADRPVSAPPPLRWATLLMETTTPVGALPPQVGDVADGDDYTGRGAASAPQCAGLPSCGMRCNGSLPEPPGGSRSTGWLCGVLFLLIQAPRSARCSVTSCKASAGGGSSRLCARAWSRDGWTDAMTRPAGGGTCPSCEQHLPALQHRAGTRRSGPERAVSARRQAQHPERHLVVAPCLAAGRDGVVAVLGVDRGADQ